MINAYIRAARVDPAIKEQAVVQLEKRHDDADSHLTSENSTASPSEAGTETHE